MVVEVIVDAIVGSWAVDDVIERSRFVGTQKICVQLVREGCYVICRFALEVVVLFI